MAAGSGGCQAALASRQLTPAPILRSSGTARLPPSISSLTTSPTDSLAGYFVGTFSSLAALHGHRLSVAVSRADRAYGAPTLARDPRMRSNGQHPSPVRKKRPGGFFQNSRA